MSSPPVSTARDYARTLLTGTTLAAKLAPPPSGLLLADDQPPEIIAEPGRPATLGIVPGRAGRVPPVVGMRDPNQRARILHALANHELQAIELFAWALLAFPAAPETFRRGLVAILADEQRHLGLYIERLAAHGASFGDHPVTGHFWKKLDHFRTPLRFCCAMGLTFENANLDFALEYARAARRFGDLTSAEVLETVHHDEISHVRFGWVWMNKLADAGPDADPWHTYLANLEFPLGPNRARGKEMDPISRRKAGISDAFIANLEAVQPTRASGAPR